MEMEVSSVIDDDTFEHLRDRFIRQVRVKVLLDQTDFTEADIGTVDFETMYRLRFG